MAMTTISIIKKALKDNGIQVGKFYTYRDRLGNVASYPENGMDGVEVKRESGYKYCVSNGYRHNSSRWENIMIYTNGFATQEEVQAILDGVEEKIAEAVRQSTCENRSDSRVYIYG